MMDMTTFLARTKMLDINGSRTGVVDICNYLSQPEIVNKMIIASDMELPVLTLIAKELEEHFDENSTFPVCVLKNNANATARQNVGRIVKFIMGEFGYTPKYGKLSDRTRLPAISNSQFFSTSAVYEKTEQSKYQIQIKII